MKKDKKIAKLINDNYNLAIIINEYCTNPKYEYDGRIEPLSTLTNIISGIADELNYLYNYPEGI